MTPTPPPATQPTQVSEERLAGLIVAMRAQRNGPDYLTGGSCDDVITALVDYQRLRSLAPAGEAVSKTFTELARPMLNAIHAEQYRAVTLGEDERGALLHAATVLERRAVEAGVPYGVSATAAATLRQLLARLGATPAAVGT